MQNKNPDFMDNTHSLRIETIRDLFCPARESKTRMHGLKKKKVNMKRNVFEHHYHSCGLNVCKFIIYPKQLGINIMFTHIIFHAGIVMNEIYTSPRNDILYENGC